MEDRVRLRGWLSNLLLLVVSTGVSLLGAELVLRLIEPTSPPGTTYGRPVQKNSYDFRDREFAIPKPADTYRILVLGDSFTWGVGLDVGQTIPKQLEDELRRRSGGRAIDVINAAIPGTNTVDQLLLLQDRALTYDPDMLVLIYNLNDIDFKPVLAPSSYDEGTATPVVQIDPGDDVTQWSKSSGLRGLILQIEYHSALARFMVPRAGQLLQRAGVLNSVEFSWVAKVFQGFTDDNPGWLESKRALEEIARICKARNVPFVIAIYPLLVGLDDYQGRDAHEVVRRHGAATGVAATVDLLPLFENKPGRSFWINYADGHPNAQAHRLVTEALLPVVQQHADIPRSARHPPVEGADK
ncbi:MAG: hypothetical protein GEU82_02560 [Luteitalea sp.]|nr:hypothetical protein [Luteitalea sp.]